MNKTNFLIGMGLGIAVGGCAGAIMMPGEKGAKNVVSKTLKTMGDVVDAVSSSMSK